MKIYNFEWYDLLPFIVLALLLLRLSVGNHRSLKRSKQIFWVLFVFAGIRYGIGHDYFAYVNYVKQQVSDNQMERIEPLSKLLLDIATYTHFQVFFIASSFITIFPVYYVCKKWSIDPCLSLIVYALHPMFYLAELGIVRSAMSFSFTFLAISFLVGKNLRLSLICAVLAVFFHKAAMIGFVIYPLYYLKNTRFVHLSFYLFSFGMSLLVMTLISQYSSSLEVLGLAEKYMNKETTGGGTLTYAINIIAILNLTMWNKLSSLNKNNQYFLSLFNIGICMWNIFLNINITLATRLGTILMLSLILIVPCYCYIIPKKRMFLKKIVILFFLIFYSSSFIINALAYQKDPSQRMPYVPYQTVFYYEDYSNYIL